VKLLQSPQTPKIAAIAVGTVVVIVGVAVGGHFKQKHDAEVAEAARQKAAAEAYANRPIITEECVLNGFGEGNCTFTNTGKTTGAKCGGIAVQGPGIVTSELFCSGQVPPMTTNKVEFSIPAVRDLCDNNYKPWYEVCSFTFVEKGADTDTESTEA